jgi:hypothetical protein
MYPLRVVVKIISFAHPDISSITRAVLGSIGRRVYVEVLERIEGIIIVSSLSQDEIDIIKRRLVMPRRWTSVDAI